jgi:hypothetical protein
MSQQVVVEKVKNPLIEFAKSIESEYLTEDQLKLKQSQKRRLETEIRKKLIRHKDYIQLRALKTKMLNLEVDFDPTVLQKLKEIREKIARDENIQKVKSEISSLRKELRKIHENNRVTYFTEIKKLIP